MINPKYRSLCKNRYCFYGDVAIMSTNPIVYYKGRAFYTESVSDIQQYNLEFYVDDATKLSLEWNSFFMCIFNNHQS